MSVPIRNLWQNQNCPIMQKLLYFFNYLSAFEDGLLCDHRPRKISTIARALRLYSSIYLCSNVINTSMQDHRKEIQAINYKFPLQPHQKYYIHTVWRTWLFIAYSDERWLYCQLLLLTYQSIFKMLGDVLFQLGPSTPKSDQFRISAAPEMLPYSMKNLAFQRFRWLYWNNPHYLTRTCLLKRLGECTFWTWEWKGLHTHTQLLRYIQVLIEVWMVITFWTWKTNFVCLSTARLLREICTAALLHRTIKPQNARLRLTETESEGPEQMWGE